MARPRCRPRAPPAVAAGPDQPASGRRHRTRPARAAAAAAMPARSRRPPARTLRARRAGEQRQAGARCESAAERPRRPRFRVPSPERLAQAGGVSAEWLQVRPMTLQDCDLLAELFAQVPGNVDPRLELPRTLTRSWVACEVASGRLLGYALGWWIVDELQLLAIATWPDARRLGVGRRLLEAVVGAARAEGAARLT